MCTVIWMFNYKLQLHFIYILDVRVCELTATMYLYMFADNQHVINICFILMCS